jgi:hypothetical protein
MLMMGDRTHHTHKFKYVKEYPMNKFLMVFMCFISTALVAGEATQEKEQEQTKSPFANMSFNSMMEQEKRIEALAFIQSLSNTSSELFNEMAQNYVNAHLTAIEISDDPQSYFAAIDQHQSKVQLLADSVVVMLDNVDHGFDGAEEKIKALELDEKTEGEFLQGIQMGKMLDQQQYKPLVNAFGSYADALSRYLKLVNQHQSSWQSDQRQFADEQAQSKYAEILTELSDIDLLINGYIEQM